MREFSAGRQAALAPLQCCLALALSWASGATPAGSGYDAAFVGMTVPNRVRAAEVFPVAVTLRNTGTNAWQGWAIRLRSIAPWYFYHPQELGEIALGQRQPGRVKPASMSPVSYPLGRTVTGACFDPRKHLLYVCTSWAYPEGLESYPIVHAYRLKSPERE